MRGCFVTGTDTGVGKSVLAAAIVAALRARGLAVCARKPVITGLDEPGNLGWPHDDALLAGLTGEPRETVAPFRYGMPAAPHLAAAREGRPIDLAALRACVAEALTGDGVTVIEGVGGLLVPLTEDGYLVRDLARDAGLPVIVAARPGLGTINHCLLTIAAARAGRLTVAGIVFSGVPASRDPLVESNVETVARLSGVAVATLPQLTPEPASLAVAGGALPLDRWLV